VAFAYCRRTPQRTLEVIVEQPSAPPGSPEEERLLTRALMTRVEKCVLEDPGEWCIFRKLSNTDERA
jgi:lauroyl/myristoyl acyltransferase